MALVAAIAVALALVSIAAVAAIAVAAALVALAVAVAVAFAAVVVVAVAFAAVLVVVVRTTVVALLEPPSPDSEPPDESALLTSDLSSRGLRVRAEPESASLLLVPRLELEPPDCCALIAATRSPLRMVDAPAMPIEAAFFSSGRSIVESPPDFLPEEVVDSASAVIVDSVTLIHSVLSGRCAGRSDGMFDISHAPQTVPRFLCWLLRPLSCQK